MRAETRYVTYDGTAFVYAEDAEYYEISHRLQAKRRAVAGMVSHYMCELCRTRNRIRSIENILSDLNQKLRNPEVYKTTEHIKLMIDRIKFRADLHSNIHSAKYLKEARAKYNIYLSRIDSNIKRYTETHDALVKSRKESSTTEKTKS